MPQNCVLELGGGGTLGHVAEVARPSRRFGLLPLWSLFLSLGFSHRISDPTMDRVQVKKHTSRYPIGTRTSTGAFRVFQRA